MEAVLLKLDSQELETAWDWVACHPINDNIENPKVAENEGEKWQYLGSYLKDGKLLSDFRHRYHPKIDHIYRCTYEHLEYDEANFEARRNVK